MARKNLSIYIDGRGRSALHRSGFSWLAFIALPLWALQRRLWLVCLLSLALTWALHGVANAAIELTHDEDAQGLLALAWLLGESTFMGWQANRFHEWLLARRGYVMTATERPAAATAGGAA
jgi:hypothetical protein